MSVYLDQKYLFLINSRLRGFKQKKENLWNFACPYCGDSVKKSSKTRGYVFPAKDHTGLIYFCHNCNYTTSFFKLLEYIDSEKFKEYTVEKFMGEFPKYLDAVKIPLMTPDPFKIININLPTIASLPSEHYAKEYINGRKIPLEFYSKIYYAEDFKLFVDEFIPNHDKELMSNDPRIVLLYTDIKGSITGVCGRSLKADKMRYLSIKLSDDRKIYGLSFLDLKKKVYILEGQFDSFMVSNGIASCDSNLCGAAEYLQKEFGCTDMVLVYDREPRNREIVTQIKKAIDSGYSVCLLPDNFPGKDLNEAHINGLTLDQISAIIDKNVYNGLDAQLNFIRWKKC